MDRKLCYLWLVSVLLVCEIRAPGNNDEGVPHNFRFIFEHSNKIQRSEWIGKHQNKASHLYQAWNNADVARAAKLKNNDFVGAGEERDVPSLEGKDHTVILSMESEQTVQVAASDIYNKESVQPGEYKTLLEWNGQYFTCLKTTAKGNIPEVTARTKLVIVGHGSSEQAVTLGGMNAHELAEAILTVRGPKSPLSFASESVQSISLVACKTGAGAKGEQFIHNVLLDLREHQLEVGFLSARTTDVTVRPDGRKMTASHRFRLGKDNELENIGSLHGYWAEPHHPIEDVHPLHGNKYVLVLNHEGQNYKITDEKLDEIINQKMEQIFELAEPVHEETFPKESNQKSEESPIELRVIQNYEQYLGNIERLVVESQSKRLQFLETELRKTKNKPVMKKLGNPDLRNVNIIELWDKIVSAKRKKNKDQNEKVIEDIYDIVSEKLMNENRFIKFGNWILKIDLESFYAEPYTSPKQTGKHVRGMQLDYGNLRKNMRRGKYFMDIAKAWMTGDQDSLKSCSEGDATLVVASHLSEAVRNPRTVLMNTLLRDITADVQQFMDLHPMTMGGSWGKNHANCGRQSEPLDEVKEKSREIMKTWLQTSSEDFHLRDSEEEISAVTDQNKIDDIIRTRILNLIPKTPTAMEQNRKSLSRNVIDYMNKLEDSMLRKSLPFRLASKMAEERQYLEKEVARSIKSQEELDKVQYGIMHDSISLEDNGMSIKVQSKSDPSTVKELRIQTDVKNLGSEQLLTDHFQDFYQASDTETELTEKVNHVLGIYGTLMGFQAAKDFLGKGRNVEAGISVAQGVHGVGELMGVNRAVSKFVVQSSSRALTNVAARLETRTAERVLGSINKLGKLADISILSVGFSVFNIYEDVERNNLIGYADAGLDSLILLTGMAGPELAPVTLALTIVRLGIDPLYSEIRQSIESLPPGASDGQLCLAVLNGIGLALTDIAESILEVTNEFNLLSLPSRNLELDKQHQRDMEFIKELKNPENYFDVSEDQKSDGCHGMINFFSGKDFAFGGALDVELDDANCVTIGLPDPTTSEIIQRKHCFLSECQMNDLVMGIGETQRVHFIKKSVTLFFFIHVHSQEVIGSMDKIYSTLHGSYKGNSKANRFYAVQELPKGLKLGYCLSDYYYQLQGRDGGDAFYLGPQRSSVQGGNGQDLYFIPEWGGVTDIDNWAEDGVIDWLIFNVSFHQISAKKLQNDLKLFLTNQHQVRVKNWFLGEAYRHMKFRSNDYVTFALVDTALTQSIALRAVSLDFSPLERRPVSVDINQPVWRSVTSVVGTHHNDIIYGNDLDNVLRGDKGADYLEGRNGKDVYVIEGDSNCDTINNFSSDEEYDTVNLDSDYQYLKAALRDNVHLEILDSVSHPGMCVIIHNWRKGWSWQHIFFMTRDFVRFQISNTSSTPEIVPLMVDFSTRSSWVLFDLATFPGNDQVMAVLGSPYGDTLYGNEKTNFLTGGEGDFLMGRGGSDTYIINCQPALRTPTTIDNMDLERVVDFLLLPGDFDDLDFGCSSSDLRVKIRKLGCDILLRNWFKDAANRHLALRSQDGVVFTLPEVPSDTITPLVYAIDKSHSANAFVNIFAQSVRFSQAVKLIGSSQNNWIEGNAKDNYIDCGMGWSYAFGGNGSDTYNLKRKCEINNYSEDLEIDQIIFPAKFAEIRLTTREDDLILTAPGLWCKLFQYLLGVNFQHVVVRSNDGVWFTFSNTTPHIIQPLYIDMSILRSQQLNLSAHPSLASLSDVYGQVWKRNFITGNTLGNSIIGGSQTDVLEGLGGDDTLQGSGGEDYLSGGDGRDEIHGGNGTDWILGGAGSDIIYPGLGADRIYGGTGSDTVFFTGDHANEKGVLVNLELGFGIGADAEGDLYYSVDNVFGSSYNDVLIGSEGDNFLSGEGGRDLILPLGGRDILRGGEGEDVYNLAGSKGLKIIDNFSRDQKFDTILLDNQSVTRYDLSLERTGQHLKVEIFTMHEADDCGPIVIRDWFRRPENQHILVQLDKTYNMEDLISESRGISLAKIFATAKEIAKYFFTVQVGTWITCDIQSLP
ncbi:uncharacterized protein si:dkey-211g8.8 [Heterodontus francisci]|uniref:uncharacterized protein si:dkey-211g8.8 n=1 Tax=Heterodontus francisci TaxID=7792 RepID=UPI00355B12F3